MYDRVLGSTKWISDWLVACLPAGGMARAPPPKKMLKMQIDPQNLLKTNGRKIKRSGDPQNSIKTKGLT
jgi:hypothetical protein